jgi:uncharacterized protein YpmS
VTTNKDDNTVTQNMFVPKWGVLLLVAIILIIVVITTTVVLVKEDNTKPSKLQSFLVTVNAEQTCGRAI